MLVGFQIWRGPARFGGPTKSFFFLKFSITGCHWAFSHCHVAAHDWATWQPTIGPHQPLYNHPATSAYGLPTQLPTQPATSAPRHCTDCHVVVWTATWHNFTGPRNDPEMPNMSDTWQPLVLPHHHADINMTHVTSCTCHICCTDADIICTDVDVSSTDVDSSPC
jgi:hypothetical protein